MKFGVCIPHYGIPLDVDNLTDMAIKAEEMGFDSVWVTDHIIVPHEIPDRTDIVYRHDMLEPLSLLTHLGAVTKCVKIGTSVIILPYRNPVVLAKAIATADVLSKGRVIFGAAIGWMEGEFNESSLRLARESGCLKRRGMRVALDTTNILGRGAVKDTYNLLADGIVKLLRALAAVEQAPVREWAQAQGYERYLGSRVKGEAAIDWADRQARTALLAKIVADADQLLELSRQAQGELPEDGEERQRIVAAAELLGQLLLQDVERTEGGVSLKDGVSRDRMMSVHDPEMRHGHKSSSRRFDGHKAAIVVDTDSQLITAVEVLPGNAPDNLGALELVEQSEANTGVPVEEAMGDAAYGDGGTRQTFADAGRTLIARVPGRPNRSHFPKEDFRIDLEAGSCTCPAGQVTRTIVPVGRRTGQTGRTYRLKAFRFDAAVCRACPLRSQCLAAKPGTGRTVRLHPQEALLQQARARQHSEGFTEYRQRRVAVEHRLARLVQLGIRQSRYFGRIKTRFQLYLAATVANLTLVAAKAGTTGETAAGPRAGSPLIAGSVNSAAHTGAAWLGQIRTLTLLASASLTKSFFPTRGFRPGF